MMVLCILTAGHSWQAQMFGANLTPESDPQTPNPDMKMRQEIELTEL